MGGLLLAYSIRRRQKTFSKYENCQKYANVYIDPSAELTSLAAPWPFTWWGINLLGPFQTALGQVKYLIIAVDYFTKWIEAAPLAKITVRAEETARDGQDDATNRVILRGLKRRLEKAKRNWVEDLPHVLWACRTTPHSSTVETPFRLTYGTEVVISREVRELTWKTMHPKTIENNQQDIREELDHVEEVRDRASMSKAIVKQRMALRFNQHIIPRKFEVGDLVLQCTDVGLKNAS